MLKIFSFCATIPEHTSYQYKEEPQWIFCYWQTVLKHWENLLADKITFNEETAHLRFSLWQKIGEKNDNVKH
jgi:hypothetical protein